MAWETIEVYMLFWDNSPMRPLHITHVKTEEIAAVDGSSSFGHLVKEFSLKPASTRQAVNPLARKDNIC